MFGIRAIDAFYGDREHAVFESSYPAFGFQIWCHGLSQPRLHVHDRAVLVEHADGDRAPELGGSHPGLLRGLVADTPGR